MKRETHTADYVIRNARILTLAGGEAPRRGAEMADLGVVERGDVAIREGDILTVGPDLDLRGVHEIDAAGRVLMPGLVDCHTHACWAGVRYDELDRLGRGESYLDILASGGGIMASVRSVRAAEVDELAELTAARFQRMRRLGATTIECKSGYGLSTEAEVKMLTAIGLAARQACLRIVPTALIAHAIDTANPHFISETIEETVHAVAEAFPGICLDAYCEKGAWSLNDCRRLFNKGIELGLPFRVHADQFNDLGMIDLAIEMGAWSVDHLEASTDQGLKRLANSDTMGVMLPVSAFHLGDSYAKGRRFIDLGGALAIATNLNPGTGPSPSLPFALSLAVKFNKLSPAEAITAGTINAAAVLHLDDEIGSIEPGKRADLLLLSVTDERALVYEVAGDPVDTVFVSGEPIGR
jgi:imidazolonepropionase